MLTIRSLFPKILLLCIIFCMAIAETFTQLIVNAPEDFTVSCSDTYEVPVVTATSPCGGISISYEESTVPGDCPESQQDVYTFTVTDACSNAQLVTVVVTLVDETSPFFTFVPEDITVSCTAENPMVFALAIDDCDIDPEVTVAEDYLPGSCSGSQLIVRTFTAIDNCGNYNTATQTITVVDNTAPFLEIDPEIVVTTPGVYASATDDCSSVSIEIISNETFASPVGPGSVVTYRATDDCGNVSFGEQTWNGCGLVGFHALNYEGLSLAGFGYSITDNTGTVVEERISTGGPVFDEFQCLPQGCYHLHIINPNPLDPNIEWHLDGAFGGTFYGFISLEYDFSVGGECNTTGCTNPTSCNYDPLAQFGTTGLCFASCGMMTFLGNGPLGNEIFGAELTAISTNSYQSFVLPDTTIIELTPFTEYTLVMSSTGPNGWNGGSLLFQNTTWNWSYQASLGPNGPFVVNFTTGGPGCMNQSACNYNPLATADDQSCTFSQTYYLDNDNDGYALISVESCFMPSAGFVLTPMPLGDCDDYNPTVHPSANEICGNNIDEDCDQLVDENCAPPAIANDDPAGALQSPTSGSAYPQGNCYAGNLVGASVSGPGNPANVLPSGGQDAWFSFIAISSAVRVVCTTSVMDIVLELQDSVGTELDMENATSVYTAGEILINDELTPGSFYYIAVRSYDGVVGPFNICIQNLAFSGCADGSGAYDLCSNFKPTYSGANSYTFTFTPTGATPGGITSGTATSQIPLSQSGLGLRHGGTYDVSITGNFSFTDAAGNDESISIAGGNTCNITIAPHADLRTKSSQRCPATVLKGTTLQAKPFICGALYHTITFTEIGNCGGLIVGGIPFSTTTSGPSSSKSLASVGGVQPGKWYMVQWTPHFAYGAGTPGTIDIIQVAGSTSESANVEFDTDNFEADISVYPNPSNGASIHLQIDTPVEENLSVRILDGTGRIVFSQHYTVSGAFNKPLVFGDVLQNGMYLIEVIYNGRKSVQKFIVTQ